MKRIITILFLSLTTIGYAQDEDSMDDFFNEVDEQYDSEKKDEAIQDMESMEDMMQMTEELLLKQNDYAVYSLEHRKKVFTHCYLSYQHYKFLGCGDYPHDFSSVQG